MMKIHPSEFTPECVYINRRRFLSGAGAVLAGALLASCAESAVEPTATQEAESAAEELGATGATEPTQLDANAPPGASVETDELGFALTPFEDVTSFNNFYEFSLGKQQVASLASEFVMSPWEVEVGGLVNNPGTFDIADLLAFEQEERIYRMRCVEAWSMVIPWVGFPLSKLLDMVEPTDEAKFVRFETLYDPDQMPGQKQPGYPWPYVEGLRLDEAMHNLSILATGIYGKPLTPQNGGPIRLVVPWKYGFKSIKSIAKIELVDEMPVSLWMESSPSEYGFYANVNPDVNHPRWSQGSERRIPGGRQPTLMFNGYEEEVAHLYEGMDLTVDF